MIRWSLSNHFFKMSHRQFVQLTTQFYQAAEEAFGTKCYLEIETLKRPKTYTTFVDPHVEAEINEKNGLPTFKGRFAHDLTPQMWHAAGHVEVFIRPINKERAPQHAFAHIEFKGIRPRQATFYMQPECGNTQAIFLAANANLRAGDGLRGNGILSRKVPAYLKSLGF